MLTPQDARSTWVRDRKTGAIVGYMTPDRKLVRLGNAGDLYARYLRMRREAMTGTACDLVADEVQRVREWAEAAMREVEATHG